MLYKELILDHLDAAEPVITDGKQEWTYRQLHQRAMTVAGVLHDMGVTSGDRILIRGGNTIDTVGAILASIALQACFILLPDNTSREQLDYIISDATPRVRIGTDDGIAFTRLAEGAPLVQLPQEQGSEALPTYILYTSGSTGKPKGVVAPQKQVRFCIDRINARLNNSTGDRILCCLPLSFDYGLYQLFFALRYGACLVLPNRWVIQQIPAMLICQRITAFPAMPAMLNMLLCTKLLERCRDQIHLRYISSTGDDLPVELIRKLYELFPHIRVIPMYGLTECKRVAVMPAGRVDKIMAGSCGLPLDDTHVYIDAPDAHGCGELIVSGGNVMAGYWNDEAVTAQYYFRHHQHGWSLRTGDLFAMDDEGFLYFKGRLKRILKVSGYRIGSVELEQKLRPFLMNDTKELRIIGVPDPICGERVALCVSTDCPSEDLIRELPQITASWPAWQRPAWLYQTDEPLPKSGNGKIDDKRLLEEVLCHGVLLI